MVSAIPANPTELAVQYRRKLRRVSGSLVVAVASSLLTRSRLEVHAYLPRGGFPLAALGHRVAAPGGASASCRPSQARPPGCPSRSSRDPDVPRSSARIRL
ncbi:hypothetical protein CSO01_02510 [Cellulomonas soli]|uniref:Uncharacterized protein n=1 Tax=Cellulomonas soli TaxID=931535 RepID=A0A512P8K3_9CELL|nr:hypothetical protein CSO01_02510 [Cellulomonas soli]